MPKSNSSKASLTTQLVALLHEKKITDDDRQRAFLHLVDWIGCATIGSTSEQASAFKKNLSMASSGRSLALFIGHFDWQNSALYNGALGNIFEMDDIHRSSILHPGPVVIPAALSMAQQVNASFEQLLDAIIVGYEVAIRIGKAIGRSHYTYFHNTATCAGFGSCMASAWLLKLNQSQMVDALGNLGSRTGGLWQMRNENVMTKQWHNADATVTGALTAWLAQCGLTGVSHILEGEQGVFAALSKDAQPEHVTMPINQWALFDTSFKPWPACRHVHPSIDAFMQVKQQLPETANIVKVEISTYQDAITFCDRSEPSTTSQAKFSIQHAIAAIILWGQPKLEHYDEALLSLSELCELRNKVSISLNSEIEKNYPQHYGAQCTIFYKDKRQKLNSTHKNELKSISIFSTDTLGDPERPMSLENIFSKAQYLMTTSGISKQRAIDICQFSYSSETSINDFCQFLTPEPSIEKQEQQGEKS